MSDPTVVNEQRPGARTEKELMVGYVIRMFPQTSETFIANEIRQLERFGTEVRIFSCRRPREAVLHDCVQQIQAPIEYLHDPLYRHLPSLVREVRAVYRRDPARFRSTARFTLVQIRKSRRLDLLKRFAQAVSLADRLGREKVHHLHAHFAHSATQITTIASMLTGIGFSFTAHARDIYNDDVDFRLLREQVDRAAFAITVSNYNRAYLDDKMGADACQRIRRLYNGVDLEKFSPGEAPSGEPQIVLAVGRLVEKKGFSNLVEAVRILRERGCELRCEIVGGGELRGALQDQIDRAELGSMVWLAGARSQDELPERYRNATVVVMPAIQARDGNRDALPTVLLEAMACGTPVVASRLTGIPEIVDHEETGLLVEPGEPVALADAIELLLRDPERRRRYGAAARAKAEREFDLTKNVRVVRDLVDAAVEHRKAST